MAGDDEMERAEIAARYLQSLRLERRSADLSFLRDITRRHVATYSFCSLGPRLGEDLPLDLESLYRRIVVQARGGYCFEQNGLLYEVLEELGFVVKLYLARVIYNQDTHPGLTHRITMVEVDDRQYVVDVGFGPLGPSFPVSMSKEESTDGHRVFRVAEPRTGEYHVQILKDGAFFSLYRFELARYGQADCEVGHFYSHKHPAATFVNNLVVSRILDGEIRSLRNREYWVLAKCGDARQEIAGAEPLRQILSDAFGIRVTEAESRTLFEKSPRVGA